VVLNLVRKLFGRDPEKDDPYWDFFLNRPLADPKNLVLDVITKSPGGGLFHQKMDVHDPLAVSGHIVQLTKFFGASLVGIARTEPALVQLVVPAGQSEEDLPPPDQIANLYPLTVVSLAHWPYDPIKHRGMGGQLGRQKVAAANFHLRSYIREIGYEAVFGTPTSPALAVNAGLGTLDASGRLVTSQFGRDVAMETVVLTNLPMVPTAELDGNPKK